MRPGYLGQFGLLSGSLKQRGRSRATPRNARQTLSGALGSPPTASPLPSPNASVGVDPDFSKLESLFDRYIAYKQKQSDAKIRAQANAQAKHAGEILAARAAEQQKLIEKRKKEIFDYQRNAKATEAYTFDRVQKRPKNAGYATESEKLMGGRTGYTSSYEGLGESTDIVKWGLSALVILLVLGKIFRRGPFKS